MPHPVACIEWRAGTEYGGIYRNSAGTWIDHHQAQVKYRLQSGVLARFRRDGKVRYLRVRRAGIRGWAYLNHDEDLARAAAEYHRSQAERYQQARRQQAPNGEWYLSPGAFGTLVGISASTRDDWRERRRSPYLPGEELDIQDLPGGNGSPTPYFSERQARAIVKARKERAAAGGQLVPVSVAAQRCGVDARAVRQLAKDRAIEADLRPALIGCRTYIRYHVSLSDLRRELRRRRAAKVAPQTITDPIFVAEAAKIAKVHPATANKWITAGKITHENLGHLDQGGRRFVVSRSEVLEFAAKQDRTLSAGGEEDWLYRRQVRVQFPSVTAGVLRYYRKHSAEVLGRPVRWRSVDRPPGLKCPHKNVRQYQAEDVRLLAGWLAERSHDVRRLPSRITDSSGAIPAMPSANDETVKGEGRAKLEQKCKYMEKLDQIHDTLKETPQRTAEMIQQQMVDTPQSVGRLSQMSATTPIWNDELSVLTWRGVEIRRFKAPAPNQRDIIEAFNRAGWPAHIDDPFCGDWRKMNKTIDDLNKSLPKGTIRFRSNGTSDGILWERAE